MSGNRNRVNLRGSDPRALGKIYRTESQKGFKMKRTKRQKAKKRSARKSNKSNTIKKGSSRGKKIEERIQEKQKLFLETYPRKACNVSLTCAAVSISRFTFYNWCKDNDEFAQACRDIEEGLVDRAESRLVECIDAHNVPAIIFFLCNKGKHRGWQNRHMLEGGDPSKPVRVIVQGVDLSKYPRQQETADSKQ